MQSWSRLTSLPVFLGRKKMEQSGKLIVSRYVRFQDFPADLDIAQFLLLLPGSMPGRIQSQDT